MRLTALLLSLALVAPAHADHKHPWPDASRIIEPPAEYQRPYKGHLNIITVPHSKVDGMCRNLVKKARGPNPRLLACAIPSRGSCTLVLPEGMPADLAKAVRVHEEAHCFGWEHKEITAERRKRAAMLD